MKMIISMSLMIMVILTMLIVLLNMISKKSTFDREKNSPFECGFDPKNLARLPFSLKFFLIALIFIIFDVELTLLMPLVKITESSKLADFSLSISIFLLILMFGLLHEQNQGSLNWVK
uniref:NADH-ubiquinone oxidoreductase chain 3 n=1 Tax=Scolytus schevyrewi TaxID=1158787 RepID=A0A6G6C905_9CUCU|nr:NADH dehydrogenase subunit 3 [Scolytus schevyrewi]QID77579.1 NADH dehydrogenase subunit 3 [Scolytus schevyrewi]